MDRVVCGLRNTPVLHVMEDSLAVCLYTPLQHPDETLPEHFT